MESPRLLRITTVPQSLTLLLRGQFRFMVSQGFVVWTCSADGEEADEVRAEGAVHCPIPFTRKITPIRDLVCLLRLIRLVRRFRPHIVHTHTPKAGLLGMIAAFLCRVPVRMHTVAGLPLMESTGWKRWLLTVTERITYACAHRVYPNSKGLLSFIQAHLRIPEEKLQLIGKGSSNGIDSGYFEPTAALRQEAGALRERLHIPAESVVFSFLGRMVRDKGLVELVQAFVSLQGDNHWLLLVGPAEPDLDPVPERIIQLARSHPRIVLAGFQRDVRPWLLAADVFVFPSYREGFPNAVMQAASLQRACIVSDINGCNEIIQDGITGVVVPPRNSRLLCIAMRELADRPELQQQFGIKARQFVATNFSRTFVWHELLTAYRGLLMLHQT